LRWDNPMLSGRGRKQARECAERLVDVNIAHIFASPFDRTMETAAIIAEGRDLLIKPEAGLCEVLTECGKPPGFWSTKRLKRKFNWVDSEYEPVYEKVSTKYPYYICIKRSRLSAVCTGIRYHLIKCLQKLEAYG
uniref:Pyridoxal-phosphate dependent enzyme n=1 Tax=Haemonchus placei TaxID=6290 RepID=A0A0N4X9W2_HAEPC